MRFIIVWLFLVAIISCKPVKNSPLPNSSETLWYDEPAKSWTEALPIGNGRLGAMIYGKTDKEIIQFNEETLWTGQPKDYAREGAHQYLDSLRNLLFNGQQTEAHELGNKHFMSDPFRQLSYQPCGNILLEFPGHEMVNNYRRELNLENAMASVSYELEGIKFYREIIASAPDQAIVMHIKADKKETINFSAGLDSPHKKYDVSIQNNVITLKGKANNYKGKPNNKTVYPESRMTFEAKLKVLPKGGELVQSENRILIKNANEVTLILVAATNFINYRDISGDPAEKCQKYLAQLNGKSFSKIKADHIKDYQRLYKRVDLNLGCSAISERPTNERLNSFELDQDPSLVALLFQYGRYLLISSSRPGTQPANLQGIWNDQLTPAWDSKYTININAEMNYWPAEITNLSELSEPIISLTEDLAQTGKNVAKEHYNLEGWVAHHNTDIWRGAAPINNANHGVWPVGGAWLCQHLWWHYQFTGDVDFLKHRAYPIMKEAARYFKGYLIPHPEYPQWLVSGPSNSPENGGMVMGPSMDHQIIRNLFANTIEAAEILGFDGDFANDLK